MHERKGNKTDRFPDRDGKGPGRINGMLLQDALLGLLLLCLLCVLFVQGMGGYAKASNYEIGRIETKWFYHD